MSVTYNGEHSVAFLYKNDDGSITAYKSWDDLFLIPATNIVVKPAEPVYSYTSVPGTSVTIDTTELISEKVVYGRRTGTWDFYIDHDKYQSWAYSYKVLLDILNGNRVVCVLRDDQDTLYSGRLTVKSWNDEETYSKVSIDYDFDYIYDESISLSEVRNLVAWVSRDYIADVPYAQEVIISPEHNPDRPRGIKPTGGYNYLSKVTLLHVPYAERLNSSGGATAWIACDGKDDGAGIPQHSEWKDAFRVFDEDRVTHIESTMRNEYYNEYWNVDIDEDNDLYSAIYSGNYHPAIEIIDIETPEMPSTSGEYTVDEVYVTTRYYLVKNGTKQNFEGKLIEFPNAKTSDLRYQYDLWPIRIRMIKEVEKYTIKIRYGIIIGYQSDADIEYSDLTNTVCSSHYLGSLQVYGASDGGNDSHVFVMNSSKYSGSASEYRYGLLQNARATLDRGTHFLRFVVTQWDSDDRGDVRAAILNYDAERDNSVYSEYLAKCPWLTEENNYQVDIYDNFPWTDSNLDYSQSTLVTEYRGFSDTHETGISICQIGVYIIRK